jgi:abequosyltransferase
MSPLVKLSVCIPTYNFGAFIGETLESIIVQLEPGVEIVVLDGGSQDNTASVVRLFLEKHPVIRYVHQPARGGIDRDMARSVELGHGEYCWLFSSDDIMKPGALKRVLSEIESGQDLYLCGLTLCDKAMNPIVDHAVSGAAWGSVFELDSISDRQRYFEQAETTTAFFSFMGSLILRRKRWLDYALDENYVGSCWAHVVRILRMIPDGLSVKLLGESLQLKRGDNDSFMDQGLVHRYALAIDGYHRIAADVFGDQSMEARHIRRVIVNEFPLKAMFFTRVDCRDRGRWNDISELDRLVAKTYCDPTIGNFFRRLGYQIIPMKVYEFVRLIYRLVRGRPLQKKLE